MIIINSQSIENTMLWRAPEGRRRSGKPTETWYGAILRLLKESSIYRWAKAAEVARDWERFRDCELLKGLGRGQKWLDLFVDSEGYQEQMGPIPSSNESWWRCANYSAQMLSWIVRKFDYQMSLWYSQTDDTKVIAQTFNRHISNGRSRFIWNQFSSWTKSFTQWPGIEQLHSESIPNYTRIFSRKKER